MKSRRKGGGQERLKKRAVAYKLQSESLEKRKKGEKKLAF